jgi:hypothetical protein
LGTVGVDDERVEVLTQSPVEIGDRACGACGARRRSGRVERRYAVAGQRFGNDVQLGLGAAAVGGGLLALKAHAAEHHQQRLGLLAVGIFGHVAVAAGPVARTYLDWDGPLDLDEIEALLRAG